MQQEVAATKATKNAIKATKLDNFLSNFDAKPI